MNPLSVELGGQRLDLVEDLRRILEVQTLLGSFITDKLFRPDKHARFNVVVEDRAKVSLADRNAYSAVGAVLRASMYLSGKFGISAGRTMTSFGKCVSLSHRSSFDFAHPMLDNRRKY